jgi:hypothetical protein
MIAATGEAVEAERELLAVVFEQWVVDRGCRLWHHFLAQ